MNLRRVKATMLGRTVECPRCAFTGEVEQRPDGAQGVRHAPGAFCLVVPAGAEHGLGVEWVGYVESECDSVLQQPARVR